MTSVILASGVPKPRQAQVNGCARRGSGRQTLSLRSTGPRASPSDSAVFSAFFGVISGPPTSQSSEVVIFECIT